MTFILYFVFFWFGIFAGIFIFSQIIFPLFFALPKSKRMLRENSLIKPIPYYTFLIAPLTGVLLLILFYFLFQLFFINFKNIFIVGELISLAIVLFQIPSKNQDLERDFANTWSNYIKKS